MTPTHPIENMPLYLHLEKILATIGGLVIYVNYKPEWTIDGAVNFLISLLYAAVYAAAGWAVKVLLDKWKSSGYKINIIIVIIELMNKRKKP